MHSCKLKIGCLFEVEHIFRENDSYIILRIPILYKISTEIYSEMFLKHHYDSQCCHIFEIIEILFEKQKFWILWFSIPYPYKFIDNSSSCPNHTDRNPLKHVSKGRNMSPPINKNKKKLTNVAKPKYLPPIRQSSGKCDEIVPEKTANQSSRLPRQRSQQSWWHLSSHAAQLAARFVAQTDDAPTTQFQTFCVTPPNKTKIRRS